jgi:DNA recombination protein RmuC
MNELLIYGGLGILLICVYFSWRGSVAAARIEALARENERMERELRDAIAAGRRDNSEAARAQREEQAAALAQIGQTLTAQLTGAATLQSQHLDSFAQQLNLHSQSLTQNLTALSEANERRIGQLRETVEKRLLEMQTGNEKKLEEMRATVDEKLHKTLEQRLSDSFKHVSERLEQVHKGLGEMQSLAVGVGDLKRVLTNVKTRGTWGEIQLGNLLEQILTPEQYERNVVTRAGSRDRVEFAIKLPGRSEGAPMWLPIDCKFPLEDFQRLQEAQEAVDPILVESAAKALETRVRLEAKSIAEKYIDPPNTSDFALLYLPIEGLYAEVLRRPGLFDALQRDWRVTLCGPTTLTAILSSLQMGFRTLAIEKRSSEVWEVLGKVKTEFSKFGDVLAKTKKKLEEATNQIGEAEKRTRVIGRNLRDVEAVPGGEVEALPESGDESSVVELLPRIVERDQS